MKQFYTKNTALSSGVFMVGGEGFEPSKAQGQQIYHLEYKTMPDSIWNMASSLRVHPGLTASSRSRNLDRLRKHHPRDLHRPIFALHQTKRRLLQTIVFLALNRREGFESFAKLCDGSLEFIGRLAAMDPLDEGIGIFRRAQNRVEKKTESSHIEVGHAYLLLRCLHRSLIAKVLMLG